MMFRQVLLKSSSISSSAFLKTRRFITPQQRSYAAAASAAVAPSKKKRALNRKQLRGDKPAVVGGSAGGGTTATPTPPPAAASSTNGSGSGGGGNMLPIAAVVVGAGAAAAYYGDLIPGISGGENAEVGDSSPDASVTKKEEGESKITAEVVETTTESSSAADSKEGEDESSIPSGRVRNITLPKGNSYSDPPSVEPGHPVGGHKVTMIPTSASSEGTSGSSSSDSTTTVDTALQELQMELAKETSQVLGEAHQELAKLVSLDLSDLDEMTVTQLKIRLVQMAKDLEERTKWEAVRLKEFLAMKEKEVEDKHVLLMKKQRLEAESLVEQKLREQETTLTTKADQALREKEQALQELIDSSLKIQEQAYEDEKSNFEKRTEEAANAKYEELFGKALGEAKENFAKKMESRTQQLEALSKKLNDLESALQTSKDFESGSVQAHRMSAAAIALIDRLESHEAAGPAMNALKAIASDNAVVTSALESLPDVVAVKGVASIQELQTIFEEKVNPKCRQAANVPDGQVGLEGQLLGMAFATLKYPPGPDDPAPEDDVNGTEYVLARARRHVQLGNLEQATIEMDKLTGQAAYTAKDWVELAKDRVAVEKALKVIRLECALANDTMGKAAIAN